MVILRHQNLNLHCGTAAAAKSLQSCLTLCDPIDGSPPGSPVPGSLQAITLEWVAISFSNAWKLKVKVKLLSRVRLLATPQTAAYQAPPSMGFFQARVLEWGAIAFPNTVSLQNSKKKQWKMNQRTFISVSSCHLQQGILGKKPKLSKVAIFVTSWLI